MIIIIHVIIITINDHMITISFNNITITIAMTSLKFIKLCMIYNKRLPFSIYKRVYKFIINPLLLLSKVTRNQLNQTSHFFL